MDPYQVLGISKSASLDDVKSAYRKLAKKYHPDLNPGNKDAEKKFKELNTANAILSDPDLRGKYDRGEVDEQGSPKAPQGPGPGFGGRGGGGPYYYETQQDGGRYSSQFGGMDSDIFESIFGQAMGGRGRRTANTDQNYSMEISFKDAALGAEQEITLPTGKKVKVKIPAGMESGKKIRLKGLASPGDVYVEIQVQPSKLFTRVGHNLELELPISLTEAVLGGEVPVPTLDSAVMMKIPAGSSSGSKLRVRGKGIAGGDLLVILKIVMPPKVDSELQEDVRKWSQKNPYNPREGFPGDR